MRANQIRHGTRRPRPFPTDFETIDGPHNTAYRFFVFSRRDPSLVYETLWVRQRHELGQLTTLANLWLAADATSRTALATAMSRTMTRVAVFEIAREKQSITAQAALEARTTSHRRAAAELSQELLDPVDAERVATVAGDVWNADVPTELLERHERWLADVATRLHTLHGRNELGPGQLLALRSLAAKYTAVPVSWWTEDRELDFREELDHHLPIDFMPL